MGKSPKADQSGIAVFKINRPDFSSFPNSRPKTFFASCELFDRLLTVMGGDQTVTIILIVLIEILNYNLIIALMFTNVTVLVEFSLKVSNPRSQINAVCSVMINNRSWRSFSFRDLS